jgi:hypothetical protein
MIAELFGDAGELPHIKTLIHENIVDAQGG